jgi:hypothetical protein
MRKGSRRTEADTRRTSGEITFDREPSASAAQGGLSARLERQNLDRGDAVHDSIGSKPGDCTEEKDRDGQYEQKPTGLLHCINSGRGSGILPAAHFVVTEDYGPGGGIDATR